jgi:hypothetical protein
MQMRLLTCSFLHEPRARTHTPPPMKMRKTSELPSKICLGCGLPFAWRKKWERDWENVKFCSERCRRAPQKLQGGR